MNHVQPPGPLHPFPPSGPLGAPGVNPANGYAIAPDNPLGSPNPNVKPLPGYPLPGYGPADPLAALEQVPASTWIVVSFGLLATTLVLLGTAMGGGKR